jgi:predicted dehydrogenase
MEMVLIGAGQRGRTYADYIAGKGYARFTGVAEPNIQRREAAAQYLNVPPERCYDSAEALWAQGRIADAAIIASMDQDHYAQAMAAMELEYDIMVVNIPKNGW